MRFNRLIGSRTHGMMDYPMGALMMSTPLLFKLDRREIATWLPVAIGASMAAVAALTNFEAGVKKKIPFRTHLLIDIVSGAALAVSPLLFRSRAGKWIPHVALGLGELLTALMTKPQLDSRESSSKRSSRSRSRSSSESGSSSSRASSSRASSSRASSSRASSSGSSSRSRSRRSSESGSSSDGSSSGNATRSTRRSRSTSSNGSSSNGSSSNGSSTRSRSRRTDRSSEGSTRRRRTTEKES